MERATSRLIRRAVMDEVPKATTKMMLKMPLVLWLPAKSQLSMKDKITPLTTSLAPRSTTASKSTKTWQRWIWWTTWPERVIVSCSAWEMSSLSPRSISLTSFLSNHRAKSSSFVRLLAPDRLAYLLQLAGMHETKARRQPRTSLSRNWPLEQVVHQTSLIRVTLKSRKSRMQQTIWSMATTFS